MPAPRGELSDAVFRRLRSQPTDDGLGGLPALDAVSDDDGQVTLFVLQSLDYRRHAAIDEAWDDEPTLLVLRAALESREERRLRETLCVPECEPGEVGDAVVDLVDRTEGASLSAWMDARGTLDHLREFVVHRALYQLREADPHSFALPRLEAGVAKAALLEIQADEYGGHRPSEAHAELFRSTMRELGLEPDDGADVDRAPATTLRTNTVLHLFTRGRRLLPALLGHLAVFEMTSVEPMAHYAAAVRRLLHSAAATRAARFYDVHVAADGWHAQLALDGLVRGFANAHPDEAKELLFGAAALLHVEGAFAAALLTRWAEARTSLRVPLADAALAAR